MCIYVHILHKRNCFFSNGILFWLKVIPNKFKLLNCRASITFLCRNGFSVNMADSSHVCNWTLQLIKCLYPNHIAVTGFVLCSGHVCHLPVSCWTLSLGGAKVEMFYWCTWRLQVEFYEKIKNSPPSVLKCVRCVSQASEVRVWRRNVVFLVADLHSLQVFVASPCNLECLLHSKCS